MKKILTIICMAMMSLLILTSCGNDKKADGSAVDPNKPITIGTNWVVGDIAPTKGGTPWSLISEGIGESVYKIDEKGHLFSRFVDSLVKTGTLTWEMTLKKGVKFSDGSEVNGEAICNSLNTVMEENPLSNATAGKVHFTKEGDYKVVVVTERETQNLDALLAEWTNIVFKKTDKGYVFTGPYMVKKLDPKVQVILEPNPHYPDADKRGEVIIKAFKDATALKMAYQANEVDLAFGLTPEMAKELKENNKIVKKIDAGYQYFGIVNLKSDLMADKKIREAIDLGINREDYIKALNGGRVATGIFASYYPFAGDSKSVYNLEAAKQLLEDAGWILNKKGIREKNGQTLTIRLLTYNSRADLKIIMQVMESQFKQLGFEVKTQIVDSIDTEAKKGNFDLMLYAQHTAPSGDPAFYLNQFFRTNGPKNMSHYSNAKVDAMLDQMGQLPLGDKNYSIAKIVQNQLHEDLPVLFLVDPEWNVALSQRLKDYHIYNGDYFIVNDKLFKK